MAFGLDRALFSHHFSLMGKRLLRWIIVASDYIWESVKDSQVFADRNYFSSGRSVWVCLELQYIHQDPLHAEFCSALEVSCAFSATHRYGHFIATDLCHRCSPEGYQIGALNYKCNPWWYCLNGIHSIHFRMWYTFCKFSWFEDPFRMIKRSSLITTNVMWKIPIVSALKIGPFSIILELRFHEPTLLCVRASQMPREAQGISVVENLSILENKR